MMKDEVLAALDATIEQLEAHGWKVHGFALARGEDLVLLRGDGVVEYVGSEPWPPEVLAIMKQGEAK